MDMLLKVGAGGDGFPSVSSSLLWLDRNQKVYSDTAGTTPSGIGDTLARWDGVNAAWGLGTYNFQQSTSGLRFTLRSDGLQDNGSASSTMIINTNIVLTGDFTCYWISSRTANTQPVVALAGTNGSAKFGYVKEAVPTNLGVVAKDDGAAVNLTDTEATASPGSIKRVRRLNSGTSFFKAGSVAEVSGALAAGNVTIVAMGMADFSTGTSSSARIRQIVLVNKAITHGDADDLAIRAKLLALEPGATDLT